VIDLAAGARVRREDELAWPWRGGRTSLRCLVDVAPSFAVVRPQETPC